uniref:Uncharacterized protein LOC101505163 n=1 Tax=Cicer arietinum TaxID=3827 RepID=A0A1S2YNY0_CICAR|nr:uncharacterized protein LOC101505163 [Cicer arietinum]
MIRLQIESVVVFVLILLASTATATATGKFLPVHDINDPHLADLANFAVHEHDRINGVNIKFDKIIQAQYDFSNTLHQFHLIFSVTDDSVYNKYEALMLEDQVDLSRKVAFFNAFPQ